MRKAYGTKGTYNQTCDNELVLLIKYLKESLQYDFRIPTCTSTNVFSL